MLIYLIFFAVIFSLLNIFFSYYITNKYKIILPSVYSLVFLTIAYLWFPLFLYMDTINISKIYSFRIDDEIYFISSLIIFTFFCFFYLGYFAKRNTYYELIVKKERKFRLYFIIIFFIGLSAFFTSIYMYGGFAYMLENISKVRSGTDENKNYIGAFIRIFSSYIEYAFFALFSYVLLNKQRVSKLVKLFLFLLFLFTVFKLFLDGGRGGLLSLFVGMYVIYNYITYKFKIFYLSLAVVLALFVILYGKIFLFSLFIGENFANDFEFKIDFLSSFMIEYAHLYMSMISAFMNDLLSERLFADFYYWIFKPLKLFGVSDYDSISYFNTYYILGNWNSDIPPGIIAFFLFEGGILFVIIGSFILGFVYSIFDKLFHISNYNTKDPFILAFFAIYLHIIARVVLNSDIALFIQANIAYFILIIVFFMINYFKLKRVKYV